MRSLRLLLLLLPALTWLNPVVCPAQNAPRPRLVEPIDENAIVPLKGNTLPVANARTDAGRVLPNLALTDLVLVLSRSPEQQTAFDEFIANQYDASSANFHHWLEPAEVGERFGPSLQDIATINGWLKSHGLTIAEVSKDRMAILFGGTAAQVESAFHTEIHNLRVNGEPHIANMSDPEIPAALAPVVVGVKALHDFHPRPMHRLGSKVQFNSSTGNWHRIADSGSATVAKIASPKAAAANPDLVINGAIPIEDVSPYDFATIYNVLPLWNAGIDGTGQTIAIVATSDVNPADVAGYRSIFGLPAGPALKTIVANGVDPGQCTVQTGSCTIGDLFENTLDVEVSGAVAKGAQIDLVVSGPASPATDPVYSSASYVIENNTAKILSVSYGLCELFLGNSGNTAWNNLWATAAVEGIGVFVATGDSGSPACDQGLVGSVPYGAQDGLSVSGLASTPYNTAVGGTDFAWCKPKVNSTGHTVCSNTTSYWSTTNNSTTGANAANYVPEIAWDDSCTGSQSAGYLESIALFLNYSGVTDPESTCNWVVNNYGPINAQQGVNLAFFVDSVGGGGGASNCTNNTTDTATNPDPASCSGGYSKPTWQTNVPGIPSDGKRDIPDVSFFSGDGVGLSATLVCVSEAGQCLSSTNPGSEPTAQEVGGTSVAAPEMAGVMALINQKAGAAQGNLNGELYALAARQSSSNCSAENVKTSSSCYFNDVDSSTIAMPCQAGALNCTVAHSGDSWGILSGFSAGKGFDQATGLGSLNVSNVVNNWTSTGGTATATVKVTLSQTTVALNQSLTVTVSVTGGSGTPTGNVGLVSSGYTGTSGALSSGSYMITIPAYSLVAGTDTLTVSYGGDATYAESSTTASVTVNKIAPTVSVQPSPTTIGANSQVQVTATITGVGPTPTGTVQLTGGGYTSSNCTLNSSGSAGLCNFTIPPNSLNSGTDTLTIAYSGDKTYLTAAGTATVTVNSLVPTVTVTPSLTNLETTTVLPVTVTVTGAGPVPTGGVQLLGLWGGNPGNGSGLGGTLSGGSYTFTIQPASLYAGTDTLYGVYAGDSVYVPKTVTTTVTVTKATPSITVTPPATSIVSNASLTLSGTVTGLIGSGLSTFETVSVTGGGYSGYGPVFNGATFSIIIPPGSLSPGNDTLTVTYLGDTFFNQVSTTTAVTVTPWAKVAPTSVTVTPNPSNVDTGQSLNVTVAVSGANGIPTGSVQFTAGSLPAQVQNLANGSATFTILPNSLSAGTVSLSANYSGDATYLAASQSGNVTVTQSAFSLTASATTPASVSRGGLAASTITVASSTNYNGLVTLACALTSGPSNQAGDSPACSISPGVLPVGGITSAVVTTVAATTGALIRPGFRKGGIATGATALALIVLWGIPSRRRKWRTILGLLGLLLALEGFSACGGGGGSSGGGGGGGSTDPGTASGLYTFTVTGTGNPAVAPASTATFTVTVN
jgi:hypothetical protein